MVSFADVNGVHMYYETYGSGDPILLLHGGIGEAMSWQSLARPRGEIPRIRPRAARQGRTADVDGEISYQNQAEDIVAFLEQVVSSPLHLVGASDGGVVGLCVVMQ